MNISMKIKDFLKELSESNILQKSMPFIFGKYRNICNDKACVNRDCILYRNNLL